jgi:hypothetical protein
MNQNNTGGEISILIGATGSTLDTSFQYDVQVILTVDNHPDIVRTTYISVSSFIIDINTAGNAVGIGMAAPDGITGNSQLHIDSDVYFYNHVFMNNITTIYNTKLAAPSTQNSWAYTPVIDALADYNIVFVRCECNNIRQLLVFCRKFGDNAMYISDMSGPTYVRGGYIVDWTNNKVGVRWVDGTSSLAENIYIQQVYGIL